MSRSVWTLKNSFSCVYGDYIVRARVHSREDALVRKFFGAKVLWGQIKFVPIYTTNSLVLVVTPGMWIAQI